MATTVQLNSIFVSVTCKQIYQSIYFRHGVFLSSAAINWRRDARR